MDGVWVYPVDEAEEALEPEQDARLGDPSPYLVVFLESEMALALAPPEVLGHSFCLGDRIYEAMDEVVVFDWMTSAQGRLVGVRNLLPPERLLKAYHEASWSWVSHEQEELRLWFGSERDADLGQTVQRCVFADPYRSADGHLALAYDTYALQPDEVERLRRFAARWVEVGPGTA